MKRIVLIILFCVACGKWVHAQDTLVLNLQQAIDIGVSKSVDAMVANNSYISSYWAYRNYRTDVLPEVVLDATTPYFSKSINQRQNEQGEYGFVKNNYNYIDGAIAVTQNIPWTGGAFSFATSIQRLKQSGKNASYYTVPFAVTFSQPLSGFNRLRWRQRIEPVKYKEAKLTLMSEMENVALTAIEYYFDLLLGQINMEISAQNLQNTELLYNVAEAKRTLGQISEAELMQMNVSLLNARSSYIDASAGFDSKMFQLRSFLGLGENVILKPEIPDIPLEQIPQLGYVDVLNKARENNAFTHNVQRRMLEATRDLREAKSDRWNISLYAKYGYSGQQDFFGSAYQARNLGNDQVVSVGMKIPILDWGKQKSKVAIAKANMNLVQSQVDKEELDFDQNIYLSVQNFNYQPRKVLLAREADVLAGKRYDTTVEAFMLGKIEILNLNDSQDSKDVARKNYIQQLYELWAYYYQIRSLTLYDYLSDQDLSQLYEF